MTLPTHKVMSNAYEFVEDMKPEETCFTSEMDECHNSTQTFVYLEIQIWKM